MTQFYNDFFPTSYFPDSYFAGGDEVSGTVSTGQGSQSVLSVGTVAETFVYEQVAGGGTVFYQPPKSKAVRRRKRLVGRTATGQNGQSVAAVGIVSAPHVFIDVPRIVPPEEGRRIEEDELLALGFFDAA